MYILRYLPSPPREKQISVLGKMGWIKQLEHYVTLRNINIGLLSIKNAYHKLRFRRQILNLSLS